MHSGRNIFCSSFFFILKQLFNSIERQVLISAENGEDKKDFIGDQDVCPEKLQM